MEITANSEGPNIRAQPHLSCLELFHVPACLDESILFQELQLFDLYVCLHLSLGKILQVVIGSLTLLQLEWPKLQRVLAILSAVGLRRNSKRANSCSV